MTALSRLLWLLVAIVIAGGFLAVAQDGIAAARGISIGAGVLAAAALAVDLCRKAVGR